MRVLHIMSGFGGGISSFIRNIAQYVITEDIQFDVATYDDCPIDFVQTIENTGGEIYTLKNPKTTSWRQFRDSFTSILENKAYDIVYCHINGYRVLPYYFLVKKYSDARFYIHAHSTQYPENMLTQKKKLLIKFDQFVNRTFTYQVIGCGSLANRHVFGDNISTDEMMVIPNSVEIDRFIKEKDKSAALRKKYREQYQLEDDEIIIGHIGRLEAVKNHELTIRLGEYILKKSLPMKILIIGEGNREAELKALVTNKNLNDVILFTGRISPIEDFFPTLDVLLLPSFAEGLPTVVVESQASGVPVVMSNTITKEVDLGFNMLRAVDLNEDISKWIEAIEQTLTNVVPDNTIRKETIESKKFSNDASAKLYIDFLEGRIHQYTID